MQVATADANILILMVMFEDTDGIAFSTMLNAYGDIFSFGDFRRRIANASCNCRC